MAAKREPKYWWLIATMAAVFVSAGYFSVGALTSQWRYEEEARQAANYYSDDADRRERQVCIPGPRAQLGDCLAETRDSERDDQRAEYNLEAQRTSALWTAVMGWMSSLAVALSAIGVYLIYRTFRQTQTQAKEMEVSVAQAGRTAVAMEGVAGSMAVNAEQIVRSVDLQRRYGQMQLRPYLTVMVGQGVWQDDANHFEVQPKVWNAGHTPAKDVSWRIAVDVVPIAKYESFRFPLPEERPRFKMIIASHQDYNLSSVLPFRVSEEDAGPIAVGGGEKALVVWGYLSYRDSLGRRYLTTFAQQVWWSPTRDKDGNVLAVVMQGRFLHKHNRAN